MPIVLIRFFIWFAVFLVSLVYALVSQIPLLRLPFLLLLTGYNVTTIIVGFIANLFDLDMLFELIGDNIKEAREEFLD